MEKSSAGLVLVMFIILFIVTVLTLPKLTFFEQDLHLHKLAFTGSI